MLVYAGNALIRAIELFRQARAGLKKTGRAGATWHTPALTQAHEKQHVLEFGVGFTLTASSKVQASWNLVSTQTFLAAACSCPGPPLLKAAHVWGPEAVDVLGVSSAPKIACSAPPAVWRRVAHALHSLTQSILSAFSHSEPTA